MKNALTYLTRRCPRNCAYCAIRDGTGVGPELSTKQWIKAFDILHELGCTFNLILGNEPWLFGNKLYDIMKPNKVPYAMYTTCSEPYFSKFRDKFFKDGVIDNLSCGIDYPTKTPLNIPDDSYAKSLDAYKGLTWAKNHYPNMDRQGTITIHKQNLKYIPQLVKELKDIKAFIGIMFLHWDSDGGFDFFPPKEEMTDIMFTKDDIPQVRDTMQQLLEDPIYFHHPEYMAVDPEVLTNMGWHCKGDPTGGPTVDADGTLRVCFPEGHLIPYAVGKNKDIKDVQVGDVLLAWDEEVGKVTKTNVVKKQAQKSSILLRIHFENGRYVECTKEHPFWVVNKGWVQASKLKNEDVIMTVSGRDKLVVNAKYNTDFRCLDPIKILKTPEVQRKIKEHWTSLTKEEKRKRMKPMWEGGVQARKNKNWNSNTPEGIKKIKETHKKLWQDPEYRKRGLKWIEDRVYSEEGRQKVIDTCRKNSLELKVQRLPRPNQKLTSVEQLIMEVCADLPVKFTGNGSFWVDNKNPDFIVDIPNVKKVIEVSFTDLHNVWEGLTDEAYIDKLDKHYKKHGYECLTMIFDRQDMKDKVRCKKTISEFIHNGLMITSIEELPSKETEVFNITCSPHSNYYVLPKGKNKTVVTNHPYPGILVHNCGYRKGTRTPKFTIFDLPKYEDDWREAVYLDAMDCPGCSWSYPWEFRYWSETDPELGREVYVKHAGTYIPDEILPKRKLK